ncbi:MAG: zinc ribbon domain-containing protein [Myxococcaceae bacterium]
MLRCGACGSSMSVVSTKVKAGVRYANFGCAAHHTKGDAVCSNALTVSERKANAAILGALRDVLLAPEAVDRFVNGFNRRLATAPKTEVPAGSLDREISEAEGRVQNLTQAVAQAGWSAALGERLRAEEEHLQALRERKTTARTKESRAQLAAHPHVIKSYLHDLAGTLAQDPQTSRPILAKHLGPVTLTPKSEGPDRHYLATGALNISVPLQAQVFDTFNCGGRI